MLGFALQRRQIPENGVGGDGRTDVRTYGRTDGQIPPVFYRTSSPSGPLPKKEKKKKKKKKKKEKESKKEKEKEIRKP